MINRYGYDERYWGNLEQRQTLYGSPKPRMQGYAGFEALEIWHPYEDLPRLPLEDRFHSFTQRLDAARNRLAGRLQ
jgi:hypothetical protein